MTPVDLTKIKVFPLDQRVSDAELNDILVDPDSAPPAVDSRSATLIAECAAKIRDARNRGASVMFIYGAHLIKTEALQS